MTEQYAAIKAYLLSRLDTTGQYVHTGQYDNRCQLSFASAEGYLYVTVIVNHGLVNLGFEIAGIGEFWEKIELCDQECFTRVESSLDRHLPGCFSFEEI